MNSQRLQPLYDLIIHHEDWLMNRILEYAKERGYTKYTSTLAEAWRVSICGLSTPLMEAIQNYSTVPELDPDADYYNDPIASFGIREAQRHRSRGITLNLFLGLMKYYRQAYLDLLKLETFSPKEIHLFELFINRFFDRIELGFCVEWIGLTEDTKIAELQEKNRILTNEKNKYLTIFESINEAIFLLDESDQIINLNQKAAQTFTDLDISGAFYYSDSVKEIELPWLKNQLIDFHQQQKTEAEFELEIETKQGKRTFDIKLRKMLDVSHKFSGTVVICNDITARKKVEEKINILYQACEQSPVSIVITDARGNIEYVNPKFENVTGYSQEEVIGKNPRILKSGYTSGEEYSVLWQKLMAGEEWHGEFHNRKKNGEFYWEFASISPLKNDLDQITHFVAVKEDITQRKKAEELLAHQANYDSLTDLPNRILGMDRLKQAIFWAKRNGKYVAVIFLDLDHFKTVNDTLGHKYGDRLLIMASQRITECLRQTDTVSRLGGDEFLIIISDLDHPDQSEIIAKKILKVLQKPFPLKGEEIFISASIGITIYPDDSHNLEVLMQNADMAMYAAKRQGRNNFQFFTATLNEDAKNRMLRENYLRNALKKQEIYLVYQPFIDLKTGKVIGAEALMRWHNYVLGMIPPQDFIPIAEETGLIVELGEWLLENVCQNLSIWHQKGYLLKIAVNLSPRQFRCADLPEILNTIARRNGIDSHYLELEITEDLLLEKVPGAKEILQQLHALDFSVSMDDFGTGYSSLSYLQKFPFKVLKIDRSFIADIPDNQEAIALVKTIIAMGHSLNLQVVAEGIETEAQLHFLQAEGCDFGQGFFFSHPLISEEFMLFLEKNLK